MLLSVVIPAYNESSNIIRTAEELSGILKETRFHDNYEILIIDDHSTDATFDTVAAYNDARVKCIRLSRRSGSHTALRVGLKNARGECILCISADGQDNPTAVREMIFKWESGAHIVWALRLSRDEPWSIKMFALLFYRLIHLLLDNSVQSNIDFSRADFYILDRKVVEAVNSCGERNTSLFGLIISLGFKQDYVEYSRRERISGSSKWNFKSRLKLAMDWVIAFSGIPLRIMTLVGFIFACLGLLYSLYLIAWSFYGSPAEGWSSIMVAILVLGGIQMIMCGIIGEYLWRNLEESRMRPLYFIEKTTKDT